MRTGHLRSLLRWASEYVVTAERAGNALLVMAAVLLVVARCLPWWTLKFWIASRPMSTFSAQSDGFSGWGWLSFAGGLLALPLVAKLVVARRTSLGKHLDSRALAGVTVAAGITELLGNLLFVVAAPKTVIAFGGGQYARRGLGLDIAMVAGVVLIASGLIMVVSRSRRAPASSERDAAPMPVGQGFRATPSWPEGEKRRMQARSVTP